MFILIQKKIAVRHKFDQSLEMRYCGVLANITLQKWKMNNWRSSRFLIAHNEHY